MAIERIRPMRTRRRRRLSLSASVLLLGRVVALQSSLQSYDDIRLDTTKNIW
jgi:hypothetical protein